MVKVRTATVASMVVLLSTTLGAALAQDAWGDAAQYTNGDSVTQQQQHQQSTDAPATWEASKKSDDSEKDTEDKKSDKSDDTTDAPSSSWTPAPSTEGSGNDASNSWKQGSGNYWSQGATPSWGSSKKSDNTDDDNQSDTSSTEAPATSEKSGKSDDDNNDVGSSKSSKTSESNDESWKQEPITFSSVGSQTSETSASSTGSETSETTTSSTGSQTTGTGGGSTTPSTSGGSVPDGTWPTSAGTVQFAEARIIKAGDVFDGKMKTYERSDVSCEGQTESGADTAVFKMEPGSTLKNVIIGKNQMEGVHCDKHDCTIENVWWDDVCEDALSVKGGTPSSVTTVTGGGARSADDKVIQHNGFGTVKIDGFYGEDISKLYRSCGTCGDKQRKVDVSNVYIVNPDNAVVTVNKNWKDEATLSNIWVKSAGKKEVKICQWSQGNADGEPSMLGDGPSPPLCQYSESDIHLNQDVSKAGGSTPATPSTPSTPSEGSSTSEFEPSTPAPASDTGGSDEDALVPSVAGSQTSETPTTESSGTDNGGDEEASLSKGADNDENTSTGSETSGDETTQGSSTSEGGQTSQSTTSTSGGTLPDGTWPTSTGSVKFTAPRVIKAGEVFDGKMQTFDRSDITCTGGEGQKDTAVFLVEAGGTLKNAIIGKNQKEGVHCDDHDCTIENVWWDDVCEDALSIKGGTASSVTTVTNCGAKSASDKVVQHNGQGTVNIDGFYAEEFGKLYRSCGTCGDIPRTVTLKNVYAVNPLVSVVTVNKNYGDKATLSNIWVKTSNGKDDVKVCQWSEGSKDPKNVGDGPSPPLCQYTDSDIHINQDISKAGASGLSKPSTPTTPSDGSSTSQTQSTEVPTTSSESNDDVAGSEEAGSDDAGSDDNNTDTPAVSSAGSQTSWSNTPTTSTESSETDEGSDATTPAGSETSETTTSSTGSQTTGTGGGGTTPSTSGGSVPDGTWPTSAGTVQFAEARIIKAGEVFDGKMKTYERSDVSCEGQTESGADTAVFKMEPGSTLKNVIIGKNQMEGVHCDKHDCTIENVWWDDVCEDALSVKGGTPSSVTTVTGGGARSADDKVIQHNGFGTVKIDGFYGEDISKLYRSCGTCGDKQRKVDVSNVYIVNPDNAVVTVNKNWKDEATLSNIWVKSAGKKEVKICQWSQGNADGEPSMLGDGPSPPLCQYSESDIHLNQDVSKAGGSTPATPSTPSTPSEGSSTSEELPGTVSPDSPTESSGNADEGNTPSQQTQESTASSTEGSVGGGDDNADTTTWSQAASKSTDENNGGGDEEQKTSSKSSNGDNNNEDKETSKASKGDDKSEKKNSGSKQEQEVSSDESVMQSEIGGEADPTAVKSEAATKESMYTSTATTSTSKCNIRRRRN